MKKKGLKGETDLTRRGEKVKLYTEKRFRANSGRWRVITDECENLSSCALVIEPVPRDVSYRR